MPTLNKIKPLFFCLIIALLTDISPASAQRTPASQGPYLRYFLLQAESLDEGVTEKVQRTTNRHEAIKVVRSCATSNQILFSVKADYPHRIQAISDEIELLFSSQAKKTEVRSVAAVPVSEISNFCN